MNEEIADDYAAWLRSWSPSQRTVDTRRTLAANRLAAWGLEGFTTSNIQTWLGTSGFSPWSRATYYSHLRDFCAWLVATGRLAEDPMAGVRRPKRPKSVPRALTEAEVDRILAAATGKPRDWILLALLSGLRAHEIAKLRGQDVTEAHIYVEGKGDVLAAIPTHPEIWQLAQRYPRSGYWFPGRDNGHVVANTVSQQVSKLFRSLGISGSIHRCRHTYGTRLLRAGTNIRVVQQLMRHASLATTEIYTAVTEDDLRDAITRLTA